MALLCTGFAAAGCDGDCTGAACADLYGSADLHRIGGLEAPGELLDPVANASTTWAAGDEFGYNWVLHGWAGGVTLGMPDLGELRSLDADVLENTGTTIGTLVSEEPGDAFGSALDVWETAQASYLMVGAPRASSDADHVLAGAAYFFETLGGGFEGQLSTGSRTFEVVGHEAGLALGSLVAGCGDIDGDGKREFALTAAGAAGGVELAGAVYVGSAPAFGESPRINSTGLIEVRAPVPERGAAYGRAVLCDRSLQDGGLANLVVGAPYSGGGRAPGAVYVYGAGPDFDATEPLLTLTGESGSYLGAAMTWANVDSDDWPDLFVGAPGVDPVLASAGEPIRTMSGAVHLYLGSQLNARLTSDISEFLDPLQPNATLTWEWQSRDEATRDADARMGFALDAGDLNGDDSDEIVVGMPGIDAGANAQAGAIVVWTVSSVGLFGGQVLSRTTVIAGDQPFQETGARFAVSDLDADGVADLVIQNRRKN